MPAPALLLHAFGGRQGLGLAVTQSQLAFCAKFKGGCTLFQRWKKRRSPALAGNAWSISIALRTYRNLRNLQEPSASLRLPRRFASRNDGQRGNPCPRPDPPWNATACGLAMTMRGHVGMVPTLAIPVRQRIEPALVARRAGGRPLRMAAGSAAQKIEKRHMPAQHALLTVRNQQIENSAPGKKLARVFLNPCSRTHLQRQWQKIMPGGLAGLQIQAIPQVAMRQILQALRLEQVSGGGCTTADKFPAAHGFQPDAGSAPGYGQTETRSGR